MPGKLSKEAFYKKYLPIVRDSVKGTGLHPETVIAQMGIESGWAGSGLTTKHNNFFGIKSHGKSGGVEMNTEEEVGGKRVGQKSNFRTYDSAEDSVKDYVRFLKTNPRYKEVFKAKTPEAQADAIQSAGYSTSSTYGKSIKQTISANKDKTKAMAKQNKGKNYREVLGDYKDKKAEVDYLARKYGTDSEEYKEKKADLDKLVSLSVYKKQKSRGDKLKSDIAEAEKNRDWTKASKLIAEQEQFDANKVEFKTKKGLEYDPSFATATHPGAKPFRRTGDEELDLDYDKIYKAFESSAPPEESVEEKEFTPFRDPNLSGDTRGGSGRRTEVEDTPAPFEDRGGRVSEEDINADLDATKTETDWDAELKDANKQLEDLRSLEGDDFVHDYNVQHDRGGIEDLVDAGRGIVGMIGATEEIPKYERGAMFSEAMGDAQRMKEMGLSNSEIDLRKRYAERGYAYDVKNIRRLAGGSAGVALGNLGRATGQLQDEYSKIAATDEAVRRNNQGAFRNMALQDEQINRQIFKDDLSQVLASKEAGAGLVQDAMRNIQERRDYNKQFGEGSIYAERMRTQDKKEQMIMHDLERANKGRVYDAENELLSRVNKAQSMIDKRDSIDVSGTSNDRKSLFKNVGGGVSPSEKGTATYQDGKLHKGSSTFKRREPVDLVEEPKKKSLFKSKKSDKKKRADEIISIMENMEPDNPEFMKLSSELDRIKL